MTFKDQLAVDLNNVFFNTDEFATPAVYTPTTGIAKTINVIFNKEYAEIIGMSASRITCLCKTADITGAVPRETIVIEGTTYKIKESPHDIADGTTEVELSID